MILWCIWVKSRALINGKQQNRDESWVTDHPQQIWLIPRFFVMSLGQVVYLIRTT
jgi:hypothetical protein